MSDRIVVFQSAAPLRFLSDTCTALAEALAESDIPDRERAELLAVYAETVCAYARVLRPEVVRLPEGSTAWPNIIDHLLERVRQARAGEITLELGEIADQLHGRLQGVATPLF